MKKLSLVIISLLLLAFSGGAVSAQKDELPSSGLTPSSPFYFLERISEGIGTFFTFGDLKKAKRYVELAAERVAEAQAVTEEGKPEKAEKALKRYEVQLEKALIKVEEARDKGKDVEKVAETVAKATSKHLTVLEDVLEKVPKQAEEAIIKALEKSKNGHITALKALAGENPDKAVEINIDSAKDRLEKAKQEANSKNKEKTEQALKDYEDLQAALEEIRGKDKLLAALVSEERIEDIEDLDEIEDEVEDISAETENKAKEAKSRITEKQKSSLSDLAKEDAEKATEINLKAAEARLNRAKIKSEEGEVEETEEAIEEFNNQNKFGEEISEIARGLGKDTTTIEQLVGKATSVHLGILAEVYEKVPAQAKSAVEKAMEISVKGHQKAVVSLKKKGVLDEVPEEAVIPVEVPNTVRERVKENAKEEMGSEKLENEKPETSEKSEKVEASEQVRTID